MTSKRAEALLRLLDELDEFEIPLNPYYDDLEPQGVIDNPLSGKINALRAFWDFVHPRIRAQGGGEPSHRHPKLMQIDRSIRKDIRGWAGAATPEE